MAVQHIGFNAGVTRHIQILIRLAFTCVIYLNGRVHAGHADVLLAAGKRGKRLAAHLLDPCHAGYILHAVACKRSAGLHQQLRRVGYAAEMFRKRNGGGFCISLITGNMT